MAADAGCVFCKIVAGTIPCYKIYEDEWVLSFLDVGPVSRGHTLVIPREHWKRMDELPRQTAGRIGELLPELSQAVLVATGATDWNILQNNGKAAHQAVDHVHFHIIPRYATAGLGIGWEAGSLNEQDAGQLVQAITRAL